MAEETVYSDSNVSVTTARVVISGTTYALRNLTSVKMTSSPSGQVGCAAVLLIPGILMLLLSLASCGISGLAGLVEGVGAGLVGLVISGGIITAAIAWMRKSRANYHVTISSSSGEAHALTSKDRNYVEKIVASINDAIVQHE